MWRLCSLFTFSCCLFTKNFRISGGETKFLIGWEADNRSSHWPGVAYPVLSLAERRKIFLLSSDWLKGPLICTFVHLCSGRSRDTHLRRVAWPWVGGVGWGLAGAAWPPPPTAGPPPQGPHSAPGCCTRSARLKFQ